MEELFTKSLSGKEREDMLAQLEKGECSEGIVYKFIEFGASDLEIFKFWPCIIHYKGINNILLYYYLIANSFEDTPTNRISSFLLLGNLQNFQPSYIKGFVTLFQGVDKFNNLVAPNFKLGLNLGQFLYSLDLLPPKVFQHPLVFQLAEFKCAQLRQFDFNFGCKKKVYVGVDDSFVIWHDLQYHILDLNDVESVDTSFDRVIVRFSSVTLSLILAEFSRFDDFVARLSPEDSDTSKTSVLEIMRLSPRPSHCPSPSTLPLPQPPSELPAASDLSDSELSEISENESIEEEELAIGEKPSIKEEKIGSEVFCSYKVGEEAVKWIKKTGFILLPALIKALGIDKAVPRLKVPLECQMICHKKGYRGTYIQRDYMKQAAKLFCYNIRYELVELFGEDFPQSCVEPSLPKFLRFLTVLQPEESQIVCRKRKRVVDSDEEDVREQLRQLYDMHMKLQGALKSLLSMLQQQSRRLNEMMGRQPSGSTALS